MSVSLQGWPARPVGTCDGCHEDGEVRAIYIGANNLAGYLCRDCRARVWAVLGK